MKIDNNNILSITLSDQRYVFRKKLYKQLLSIISLEQLTLRVRMARIVQHVPNYQ